MTDEPGILILRGPIDKAVLARLVKRWFGDMVKYVADVERGVIAIGGELHADAEELLLEDGSRQPDLWGANYYPGTGAERCIEYTSLINIRPSQGNQGMEIEDREVREQIRRLTFTLIGNGGEA